MKHDRCIREIYLIDLLLLPPASTRIGDIGGISFSRTIVLGASCGFDLATSELIIFMAICVISSDLKMVINSYKLISNY